MHELDAAMKRWAAAQELIRAGDDARLLARVGRIRQSDMERVRTAEDGWDVARTAWPYRPGPGALVIVTGTSL
jgi:hypothetical protein